MLYVNFVDGYQPEDWGGFACDFLVEQTGDSIPGVGGITLSGFYNSIPWLRFSTVYVVRQPTVGGTLRVLVHELIHAAIWLLYLPRKWSIALDKQPARRRGKE